MPDIVNPLAPRKRPDTTGIVPYPEFPRAGLNPQQLIDHPELIQQTISNNGKPIEGIDYVSRINPMGNKEYLPTSDKGYKFFKPAMGGVAATSLWGKLGDTKPITVYSYRDNDIPSTRAHEALHQGQEESYGFHEPMDYKQVTGAMKPYTSPDLLNYKGSLPHDMDAVSEIPAYNFMNYANDTKQQQAYNNYINLVRKSVENYYPVELHSLIGLQQNYPPPMPPYRVNMQPVPLW